MPNTLTQQPIQRDATLEDELQTKPLATSITPLVQREILSEAEVQAKYEAYEQGGQVQRSPNGTVQAQPDLESRLNISKTGGSSLSNEVRSFMEPRFGADFSGVRVHTGSDAVQMNRELNAQAFTHQQDVYFAEGKSPGNDALTAHELTHVVQQTGKVQNSLVQTQHIQRDPGAGASSTTSGLQRVQAAIAANDRTTLITLQHELRQQMLTDPLHPPEDARAGLATARHWTMDRIAAIRDRYSAQITAASTGGSTGTDATDAVEAQEITMDAECTPYLNVLMEGDPQYRYEHFDPTVSEKVFAAVRLHSARRGVDGIGQSGHRAKAEAEARLHGHLPEGAWCGVFAYTQAEQAGGFDSHWVESMQGEGGIRTALAYGGTMAHTWIWAFDHWENLRSYHARRNSERWYEEIRRKPPSRSIQAGDIVLIDNAFGTNPDHVTTAIAFDGRFLTTVGGNQGTSDPSDEKGVSRSAHGFDLQNNPDPNDVRRTDASGQRIREVDPTLGPKHVRVHGIGRWSIVDYERHIYKTGSQMPNAPPTTAELAHIG